MLTHVQYSEDHARMHKEGKRTVRLCGASRMDSFSTRSCNHKHTHAATSTHTRNHEHSVSHKWFADSIPLTTIIFIDVDGAGVTCTQP